MAMFFNAKHHRAWPSVDVYGILVCSLSWWCERQLRLCSRRKQSSTSRGCADGRCPKHDGTDVQHCVWSASQIYEVAVLYVQCLLLLSNSTIVCIIHNWYGLSEAHRVSHGTRKYVSKITRVYLRAVHEKYFRSCNAALLQWLLYYSDGYILCMIVMTQ